MHTQVLPYIEDTKILICQKAWLTQMRLSILFNWFSDLIHPNNWSQRVDSHFRNVKVTFSPFVSPINPLILFFTPAGIGSQSCVKAFGFPTACVSIVDLSLIRVMALSPSIVTSIAIMIWTLFRFEITVSGQAGISVGVCRRWCSVLCTIVSSFVKGVVIPLFLLREVEMEGWEPRIGGIFRTRAQ